MLDEYPLQIRFFLTELHQYYILMPLAFHFRLPTVLYHATGSLHKYWRSKTDSFHNLLNENPHLQTIVSLSRGFDIPDEAEAFVKKWEGSARCCLCLEDSFYLLYESFIALILKNVKDKIGCDCFWIYTFAYIVGLFRGLPYKCHSD